MSDKHVLFVLLDQYADWEAAPLAAVVNQSAGWRVRTVAPDKAPIRSLGGLTAMPDLTVSEALESEFAGVALIGGLSWRTETAGTVEPLVRLALDRRAVLGAICDATVFLGTLGALNGAPHTSNMLDDLKNYAGQGYSGAEHYQQRQAVRSGRLITANGAAAMDFAREMLAALEVMTEEDAGKWYRLFKFGFYEAPEEGLWWFTRMEQQKKFLEKIS